MKQIYKIIFVLTTLFSCSYSALALDAQQEAMLQKRVAEKVAQLNSYISDMATKKNKIDVRKYYMKKALNLFIGKGYSFEVDGVNKDGVKMETTSVNTKRTTSQLMRTYFERLINLKYSDVKITATEIADMKVSRLKKIDNNLYECTCEYVQEFRGFNDDRMTYGDRTTKRIKCYIEIESVLGGEEYMIMLGDVKATDTERIK